MQKNHFEIFFPHIKKRQKQDSWVYCRNFDIYFDKNETLIFLRSKHCVQKFSKVVLLLLEVPKF